MEVDQSSAPKALGQISTRSQIIPIGAAERTTMKKSILANVVMAVAIAAAVPAHALVIDDGVVLLPPGGGVLPPPSSTSATAWNLAADYLPDANPNGQWSYGQVMAGTGAFSSLPWNAATDSYGVAAAGEVFIYKNMTGVSDFGIGAGMVSLQSDWGNAAVRWIAPSSGAYTFTIMIGGSTASGAGGYGNNFAQYATLSIDGVVRSADSFSNNVKQWNLTELLGVGSIVVASVVNQGFADGGNTQTEISISAVPEPASAVLLGLGIGLLIFMRRRSAA